MSLNVTVTEEQERLQLLEKYRQLFADFHDDMDDIDDNLVPDDECLVGYLGFEFGEDIGPCVEDDASLETLRTIYPRHKAVIEAARHNLNIARVKHLRQLVQDYLDFYPKKNPHECDEKCYYVSISGKTSGCGRKVHLNIEIDDLPEDFCLYDTHVDRIYGNWEDFSW